MHIWLMYIVVFVCDAGNIHGNIHASLGPRPKTNPSADRFQYRACYTGSDIHAGEVWGQDHIHACIDVNVLIP